MPRGNGTGPDGNGPKSTNKGGAGGVVGKPTGGRQGGAGRRRGCDNGLCRRDGSCQK